MARKIKATATFKDGTVIEYRASRQVNVAWIIYKPNGEILDSGFSKHESSAKSSINERIGQKKHCSIEYSTRGRFTDPSWILKKAKENGFKTISEWQQHCMSENAKEAARYKTEIIPVTQID